MSQVTVVCGAPGAGKTRYVQVNATPGDLIVDVDTLFRALSGLPLYDKPPLLLPYVFSARSGVLARLELGDKTDLSAWIITMGASLADRDGYRARFGAQVVVLETPVATCIERISQDPRRADQLEEWMPRILKWWRDYQPSASDSVVRTE